MKPKPKGPQYRNLVARGNAIYYVREHHGRRIRRSLRTNVWETAAAAARIFEERKGLNKGPSFIAAEAPTFAEMAKRYLATDTSYLAATTRHDRHRILAEKGPVVSFLGPYRLDEITPPVLREWYSAEIEGKGRSAGTGSCHLDAIAGVFRLAVNLELLPESPVPRFRAQLQERNRTQRGRVQSDPGRNIRPIETAEELDRLLAAAEAEGLVPLVLVLLCLDAGLRLGEALGLRWGAIAWGDGNKRSGRSLYIDTSRSRGGAPGPTKSGRARTVGLSLRLREALAALYREQFEPGPEAFVLPGLDRDNFRKREWRRVVKRAGIGHRAVKDLRDTFASQLLTAGVQLGYISAQLGHADVGVTSRCYARWTGGSDYRDPLPLGPEELPADLLARLSSQRIRPTSGARAQSGAPGLRWHRHAKISSSARRVGRLPAVPPRLHSVEPPQLLGE